ncbi:hypothetical protein MesoLj131a_61830 [Mesorhizobium sp. 131-2-1]|nr:hypothetical protein MesoLj131a_61830 [Mesorhizobium sp. 131-2-1]
MLEQARIAIPQGDIASIGKIATASALLHQERVPKEHLNSMLKVSEEVGALGVIVAHSGTVIGILLDRTACDFPRKLQSVVDQIARFNSSPRVYLTMHWRG